MRCSGLSQLRSFLQVQHDATSRYFELNPVGGQKWSSKVVDVVHKVNVCYQYCKPTQLRRNARPRGRTAIHRWFSTLISSVIVITLDLEHIPLKSSTSCAQQDKFAHPFIGISQAYFADKSVYSVPRSMANYFQTVSTNRARRSILWALPLRARSDRLMEACVFISLQS